MKKRVVCFGDSNTWGYIPLSGERYDEKTRWTGILQTLLGDDYAVIEEGQNGRTTVWDDPVEHRMAGLTYLYPCMESQSPIDLLIIMLGTNDTKPYFGGAPQTIARGAGRLVDEALKSSFGRNGRPPKVLLVSPIRIRDRECFYFTFGEQAARKSEGFSESYRMIAEQFGCEFLDAAQIAEPSDADGVHMDPEEHAKMARAMAEKVRSILEEDA